MTQSNSLRLCATLLFAGTLLSLAAGALHPDHEVANDHAAAFAEYARSMYWTAIHLGQFVGMAFFVAGLFLLFTAITHESASPGVLTHLGRASALVALGLYGVLQAVDGVALKQAVDAWALAPDSERASRFASAEAVRWLEWGVRSYASFMLGIALVLAGTLLARSARAPLGLLVAASGLAYIAQGWVIGSEGFSPANSAPTLFGIASILIWTVWLLFAAWRERERD